MVQKASVRGGAVEIVILYDPYAERAGHFLDTLEAVEGLLRRKGIRYLRAVPPGPGICADIPVAKVERTDLKTRADNIRILAKYRAPVVQLSSRAFGADAVSWYGALSSFAEGIPKVFLFFDGDASVLPMFGAIEVMSSPNPKVREKLLLVAHDELSFRLLRKIVGSRGPHVTKCWLPVASGREMARDREHRRTVAFLGSMRKDKGPEILIDMIADERFKGVRFLIHTYPGDPGAICAFKRILQLRARRNADVVVGFIDKERLWEYICEASVAILPYDPLAFHTRFSALAKLLWEAEVPCVVPKNSWFHWFFENFGGKFATFETDEEAKEKVLKFLKGGKWVRSKPKVDPEAVEGSLEVLLSGRNLREAKAVGPEEDRLIEVLVKRAVANAYEAWADYVFRFERDAERALKILEKAISVDETYHPAKLLYAEIVAERDMDKAISMLEELIKVWRVPRVFCKLADLYIRAGRKKEALKLMEEGTKFLDRFDYVNLLEAYRIYVLLGKPVSLAPIEKEVEETVDFILNSGVFEKIREDNPTYNTDVVCIYNFGSVLKRAGEYEKAEEVFKGVLRKAKEIGSKELAGGACFHLGELSARRGNIKLAAHFYRQCLEFIPSHRMARRRIEEIENSAR